MELQQIIVIAIVCLCTIWISIRIFQYFKRIKNNSNPCECCSSDCAMKSMPNYDRDRVHTSDIKKLIQWYNLLVSNGETDFVETEKAAE